MRFMNINEVGHKVHYTPRDLDSCVVYGADQTKEDGSDVYTLTRIYYPNFGEHCFMSMVSTKNIDLY